MVLLHITLVVVLHFFGLFDTEIAVEQASSAE
jgi:hypothetical protein